MEADLSRYHGQSLTDLGRGLSLWQLGAYVRNLPMESATARIQGGDGWAISDYLIADIFKALAGEAHPADPRVVRAAEERRVLLKKKKAEFDAKNKARGSVLRKSSGG